MILMITICAHGILFQEAALTTVHQVLMVTSVPAHQSPTPRSPMATSVKTALYTLIGQIPLPHALHHHHVLRQQKLPLMLSPSHRHLSPAYTPGTGVGGIRQVRNSGVAIFELQTTVPPHICTSKCWKYWNRKVQCEYLHAFIRLWLWEYNE